MNNNQRDELEELKLAQQTARVLETGHCESQQDYKTHELGRLLKQSASYDLPESNEALREQLLAELNGEAVSLAPMKTVKAKQVDRIGRWRKWLALPAAVGLVVVGGAWLYSVGTMQLSKNHADYSNELEARAKAAERQVNDAKDASRALEAIEEDKVARAMTLSELASDAESIETDGYVESESMDLFISPGEAGAEDDRFELLVDSSKKQIELEREPNKSPQRFAIAEQAPAEQAPGGQQGKQNGDGEMTALPLESMAVDSVVLVTDGGTTLLGGIKWSEPGQSNGNGKEQEGQATQLATNYFEGKGLGGMGMGGGGSGGGFGGGRGKPNSPASQPSLVADRYATYDKSWRASLDDVDEDLDGIATSVQFRYRESKSGEQYAPIYENAFVQAAGGAAISTFSIDVDTASYANMRRFLNSGQLPPRDSIRIEELVNYFQYDYPQPKGDDPFSVNMELATCPWNDTHKLLRVGLKGKEFHVKERPATNVVYLIDVSGSMNSNDKLPLLKRGFQMMTRQLGENDRVSIVTYAGNAGVALEPTTGDKTKTINEAIERLSPGGSTHGSAGIELAYKLAQQHFITGGVNKVILATDGDLNVGVTDDNSLVKLIKQKASEGVFLTVLGFGTGNLKDGKLEKLADNGNGHYAYLDSNREAYRVLVRQLSGSLVTIAKDVKIQIEFNPAEVKSYRLIGYENRMLATKDFDDDRKDAGEIGAGHTVTAIYEIEPTGGVAAAFTAPSGMKYQLPGAEPAKKADDDTLSRLSDAASTGELATLALRYKKPDENKSKRIEFAIKNDDKSFSSASDDFRFAASVAGFGMLLRGSEHAGVSTPAMVLEMASESTGDDASGYRAEFLDLVRKIAPKEYFEKVFDRSDAVDIALGGFFDIDGDGVSDLEKVKRMIVRNGGRVVAWHDDDGEVSGKIDATTRFFVLGPSPRSGSREVFETMANLKKQAEANSVDIIEFQKLLNWMGEPGSAKIDRMDSRIGESNGFKSRKPVEK